MIVLTMTVAAFTVAFVAVVALVQRIADELSERN